MSASTSLTTVRKSTQLTPLDTPKRRLVGVSLVALSVATAGTIGIAMVGQSRPIAVQATPPTGALAIESPVTPRLSPWRDAWYLDDQFNSATASVTPADVLDLSKRTHDDWALGSAQVPPLNLSPRGHDDWPLETTSAASPAPWLALSETV